MPSLLRAVFPVAFVLAGAYVAAVQDTPPVAPAYTLNLDAAPAARWGSIFKDRVGTVGWDYTFKPVLDFIHQIVPLSDWQRFDKELQFAASKIVGGELTDEVKGMYQAAIDIGRGNETTVSELLFFQVFYEILMECTAILTHDSEGRVVHARNMDMGLTVKNITAQVTWTKGGKPVMVTTQFLG
jgi:hypothetical protein